jgi:hypothetical protein
MELQEGLEFYKRCLADCDRVLADLLAREDLYEERKQALIDRQLDVRNKLKRTIETIEELLK